jgi:16S rRNA (guanine527-N7)-methyltransferase
MRSALDDALGRRADEALVRLGCLLLDSNRAVNLTAIATAAGVALLHFADSLAALDAEPGIAGECTAADIGSGAGFPALPLAIACPAARWTTIESVAKKCRFIERAAGELGIPNVEVLWARAEDVGRSPLRAAFDYATARAVGPVASLCEVGLPLLRRGGTLLLFKTEAALAEADAARASIAKLGGEAREPHQYRLRGDTQDRLILRIAKVGDTPAKYPRPAGTPFRQPLS